MKTNLIFIVFLITLTSIFDTIRELLLKSAINSLSLDVNTIKKVISFITRLITIPRVWVGFLFSVLSLFIWLFVLSRVDLNFAFSVDSMHYIFIAFASSLLLKEKIGTARWLGTISIVAGIIIVTLS